ncbi:hypothetical protein ACQ4LK_22790, partial [Bacillus pumilus]
RQMCIRDRIEPNSNTEKFHFKVDEQAAIIAQDVSGGIFSLIGSGEVEKRPVLYIDSEGKAGKVGKSFNGFISLMLALSLITHLRAHETL